MYVVIKLGYVMQKDRGQTHSVLTGVLYLPNIVNVIALSKNVFGVLL